MTGTVESYDRMLRWGWIRGTDGGRYFVHKDDVLGRMLLAGEAVEFDTAMAPRGPRASRVRRVEVDGGLGRSPRPPSGGAEWSD